MSFARMGEHMLEAEKVSGDCPLLFEGSMKLSPGYSL